MKHSDLPEWSARAARWAAEYHASLPERPVRARTRPGEIAALLPDAAPELPEPMEEIFADFERIVPDGLTHWQHPRFFAYFPSNAAPASMLADQLANAIAAQCMLWQTSPVATEMEQVVTGWLARALGLPAAMTGVIHDTATTATFSAVLTMRERALGWRGLHQGLSGAPRLRIYASAETHSSVDKAIRLAGIGQDNLVKVPTDADRAMDVAALARAIAADRAAGHLPAGVVLCVGGTATGASDRIGPALAVARAEGLYTHVDAAWAGAAMICPEYRFLWEGVDQADSLVMNPHKWLGAGFDCSVQFLADPVPQVRTLGLRPDYLETLGEDDVVNFNEWTVPLGRRFRALKLWFLLRAHGLTGLRAMIRGHVAWTRALEARLSADPRFEIVTTCPLALFSFRLAGEDRDARTEALLRVVNDDGRIYLTQTRVDGAFVIRVSVGSWSTTESDVMAVADILGELVGRV
ncbi:MAG: aspartate aminotransferase family protein [Rhodobacteraceae bacterium]|nr:aspartate aminotransferase family protein [Paracoccaceae bacterium]